MTSTHRPVATVMRDVHGRFESVHAARAKHHEHIHKTVQQHYTGSGTPSEADRQRTQT